MTGKKKKKKGNSRNTVPLRRCADQEELSTRGLGAMKDATELKAQLTYTLPEGTTDHS